MKQGTVKFSKGDKVTYKPKQEKGIVKSVSDDENIAFVAYHCDGDWDNFMNYTGAATNISDLKLGWDE
jgi:hypothetical protein